MKTLLIVNPTAGQGRPQELLAEADAFTREFVSEIIVTQSSGHAEAAARRAAENRSAECVLVAGGDGTVNEVLNGLLAGRSDDGATLPMGIIPLGTQNVLAHELGVPRGGFAEIAEMVRKGHTRDIDVGEAQGRYFALMAGFGFDAAVVGEIVQPMKELMGPAAYVFGTLGALAKYRSTSIKLTLDSEEIRTEAFLVVVANSALYAYRQIRLAPFAVVDDGWLDICVFERAPTDRVGFLTQIMAALAGRHLKDPRVRYYRARRIQIESDPPIQGQLDGDMYHYTPMTITLEPRALRVLTP
ncbi:diacylglycerol/lipid kinase family protein [Capsulimonas corticalis]|nr:diacylglycerol kinase family protein [Capsulimonas corticalis]